ncbi:MAG TPA: lipopolysaccharide transport periplasmic protein LptA [Xanthomonadaceae bacterium]|jgi:lipopolysaccharide export system protein LptA|nr:lipopolysaccharide transport periplasmic protein LptA [Xanthomonadaceae bacterium]
MSLSRSIDSRGGRAVLALLLCALCTSAYARKSDRKQPMDVHSDNGDMSVEDDGVSILTGNVIVTQGTLLITADKAVITRKNGDISYAVLTGNPVHLKQEDENGDPMYGTSRQVDDDLIKNIDIFTGDAVIDQPTRGQMRGQRIVYNVDTGKVTSGNDGTRVAMHILPKVKNDATPASTNGPKPAAVPPTTPPANPPPGKTP